MEDKREFFECQYCDGEFAVETECAMDILYCPFCSEPLDIPLTDEPEDYYEEV
tara:strand:+ start:1197 stop:1355 length:159 start_codon:yes stop_codon:yes gene_type:complete